MKIREIIDLAMKMGASADPRRRAALGSPIDLYPDSGLLWGDPEAKVRTVLVGIDITPAEVLLANELERRGKKIDLMIAHHPDGKQLLNLHGVMDIQIEILRRAGVPISVAEKVLAPKKTFVQQENAVHNHFQVLDMARILGIPLANIHTPADNLAWRSIDSLVQKAKAKTVSELIAKLSEIPEFKLSAARGTNNLLFSGEKNSSIGKVVVLGVTGGTAGSENIYRELKQFGVGTEIACHLPEKNREEAVKNYINVIVPGHIASDSLGMNFILDELTEQGIEIIACSGLIRHNRKQS